MAGRFHLYPVAGFIFEIFGFSVLISRRRRLAVFADTRAGGQPGLAPALAYILDMTLFEAE